MAPITWITAPRRPSMMVPWYILRQSPSMSMGSSPMRMRVRPWLMVWVPVTSTQALASQGFTSLSPIPVIPSSVCTSTTKESCAEEVSAGS